MGHLRHVQAWALDSFCKSAPLTGSSAKGVSLFLGAESSLVDSIPHILCPGDQETLLDLPLKYSQDPTTSHHLHSGRPGRVTIVPPRDGSGGPHSGPPAARMTLAGLRWSCHRSASAPPSGPSHSEEKLDTGLRGLCPRLLHPSLHSVLSSLTGLLADSQTHPSSCLCTCSSFFQDHSWPRQPCSRSHIPHSLFKCHLS